MPAKITLTGLDDLHRRFHDLQGLAEQIEGSEAIPAEDLFPPPFMNTHTDFGTFAEMLTAAGVVITHSNDELDANDQWRQFVQARTRFESWDEMREEAAREWIAAKLGLRLGRIYLGQAQLRTAGATLSSRPAKRIRECG